MTTLSAETAACPRVHREVTPDGVIIHYNDAPSYQTERRTIFESRIYDFATDVARPLLIDGGAHIGMAALRWKRLYPTARVMCYEPDETAFAFLSKNIHANQLADVELIKAGLSDRDGVVRFEPDGSDGGRVMGYDARDHSIAHSESACSIRTVRLSSLLTEPVDMLKLNIEGEEWRVLRDLEQSGKLGLVRRLVLEYHGWPGGRQYLGDILNLLDRAGFRYLLHDFDRETNPSTKPPFRLRPSSPWFCLVYAERPDARSPATIDAPQARTPIDWGELRRITPVSRTFGFDRGTPMDRYYIEKFLACHAHDIHGRVLEVGDATYTRQFGADRVTQSDVLHAVPGNRHATIVGNLATGEGIPTSAFDCMVLTQTLLCIEDVGEAIKHAAKALKPRGVLLATLPGISQISRYDMDRWGDYWRFTTLSARRLFEAEFGEANVSVQAHGNVLAATAFLQGISVEELSPSELDDVDPDYELLITIRAVRTK